MKIGILTSHPIQYQAPWFRALAKKLDIHVFFAHKATPKDQAQAGFGIEFEWDIDLLSGYSCSFLNNIAKQPHVNSFAGCDTPDIIEIIKSKTFDVVIVNGWYLKSYLQAIYACKRYKVPVLVRGDSQLPMQSAWFKSVLKKITYTWFLSKIDAFLIVGQRFKQYLQYYKVPESKMFSVPHFVDNQWFSEKALMEAKAIDFYRKNYIPDLQKSGILLLFVGKLTSKKRPLDIIDALSILKHKTSMQVHCIFVGDGALKQSIVAAAQEKNVSISMVGFKNQSELPLFYALSDILILPSDDDETWGLVVNEGMACGLPAIVSDRVGCASDLIVEGKTGYTYPMGDIRQLADRILRLSNQLDLIKQHKLVETAIKEYSIDNAVKGTIQAIHYCLHEL